MRLLSFQAKFPTSLRKKLRESVGIQGFVQAVLPVRSRTPYGSRLYHPIYEAAVRHNLAIGIHYGGAPGNQPSPDRVAIDLFRRI